MRNLGLWNLCIAPKPRPEARGYEEASFYPTAWGWPDRATLELKVLPISC